MLIINARMKTLRLFFSGIEKSIRYDDLNKNHELLREIQDVRIIKLFSLADEPGVFEPGDFDESSVKNIIEVIHQLREKSNFSKYLRFRIDVNESTPPQSLEEILDEVYRIEVNSGFSEIQLDFSEAALICPQSELFVNSISQKIQHDEKLRTRICAIAPHDQRYFDFLQIIADAGHFRNRIHQLLARDPRIRISLSFELDVFNTLSTLAVLQDVLSLNAEFKSSLRDPAISIEFLEMTRTPWWSFKIINFSKIEFVKTVRDFISTHQWNQMQNYVGFHPENIEQLDKIINAVDSARNEELIKRSQIDFIWKISQKEESHKKEFLNVFPELKKVYDFCHYVSQQRLEKEVFVAVRDKLNAVGKGFCLAKWSNVTLHLESGNTHSCHHPLPHKIPLDELQNNSAALHNTSFKIQQRKVMIEGGRPEECYYCWNIEDLVSGQISDRHIKSSEPYSMEDFDKIIEKPLDPHTKPRYLEVSFSNKCNFKCSYCSADYSSSWSEELKRFGPYSTGTGAQTVMIYEEDENPYIKAFWHWWPEISGYLNTLRITGGEPLLSPNTFKLLESFLSNPSPNLNIVVNSNLGIPGVLFEKFENLCKSLYEKNAIKSLRIYTSSDAFGARAEYIRHGFKNDQFWVNVERCLQINEQIEVHIMCTFNALSITSGTQLIEKMSELNRKYKNKYRWSPVTIDFSYLRHPEHQSVKVLTADYIEKMNALLKAVDDNQWLSTNEKMRTVDIHQVKLRRILDWMKEPLEPEKLKVLRWRFYEFFSEHDRRRGTDFLATFPEMSEFWNLCKNEYDLLLKQRAEAEAAGTSKNR